MTRTARTRIGISIVAAVAVVAVIVLWVSRGSGEAGYSDPSSQGTITLYDRAGHAITSGNIRDKPFVWSAVSSVAAPPPYNGPGRTATLLIYQPRKDAVAAAWSGDTMTASTTYPDPAHPTATAAADEFSLQDFLSEFPARWQGRLQLRIYLGEPAQPMLTGTYSTLNIVVTGDTWKVAGS